MLQASLASAQKPRYSASATQGYDMGTISFTVCKYAPGKRGSSNIPATEVVTSGAYATSTSASNVEDAGGDITLTVGTIFQAHADEAMRLRFGGTAATASTGFYLPAGEQREWECTEAGFVSAIDVA